MFYTLRRLGLVAVLVATSVVMAQDAADLSGTPQEICDAATPAADPENTSYESPEDVLDSSVDYRAIFCTDAGAIYIDLLEDYAPETVNNFVFLAQNDYYNNTIFHRVIPDFMAQGGDRTGTGTGGPGYQFRDEPVGFLIFDRPGLLAMANAGPGTNGSQFFITTVPTPHLNYQHTIFGAVLEGDATAIEVRDPQQADAPATTLQTIVIIDDPDAVTTDYENLLETVDADFFIENLGILGSEENLPPTLAEGYEAPALVTTEDRVATVPEALQEDFAALLEANGHDFSITTTVGNTSCDEGFFFEALTYTVDAYESADAAGAVLGSDVFAEIQTEAGFEEQPVQSSAAAVYSRLLETDCSGESESLLIRAYLQRGRYVVTIDGLFPPSIAAQAPVGQLAITTADQISQIFEPFLTDAYRAELP